MKKTLLLCLALLLCVLPILVACDNGDNPSQSTTPSTTEPDSTTEPTPTEPLITREEPTISGDFTYTLVDSKATITHYTGNGGDLVIPEKIDGFTVVAIADWLFAYNEALTSVTIPGSVKETGELTFFHCPNLKSVTLGDGVEKISRSCFNSCEALETVTKTASVTSIQEIAFQGCSALKSFDLAGVTFIGYRAFANAGLTSIVIPASVTSMEDTVFSGNKNLVSADFQASVENLPGATFSYCSSLKNVTICEGIKRIKNDAFYRCSSIESIVFPSTCMKFEHLCLYGCQSLKTATILNKTDTIYIDYYSWYFMPALETVYYAGSQAQRDAWVIDNETFNWHLLNATLVCDYVQ